MHNSISRQLRTSGFAALVAVFGWLTTVRAAGTMVESVMALARSEKPKLLATLKEIVEIESGSTNLDGLAKVAAVISARLRALGGNVDLINVDADRYQMEDTPEKLGQVVRATFTGTGTARILLLAHMDTVYPRGTLAKQPWRIEGNRAYGVGIADDKHGVAVILHTLAILQTVNVRDYGTLTVLINSDEEISSPGSRALITRLGSENDTVLSFEGSSGPADNLAIATSGIAAVILTVRGRGSHSGGAPERGVNALDELAHQILQTRNLSEPATGLKMNWTLAKAGVTRNMIPPEAVAIADVRVLRVADYDRIEQKVRTITQHKLLPESQVEVNFERRRPPLEATPAARALGRHAQAIYRELEKTLEVGDTGTGGGTDAAFAALKAKGPVVERFGLRGFGAHSTDDEYVLIDSIEPRLYLATRTIMDVAQGKVAR
ncbi:MAG: glutamate carboxypeptidase [Opitutaceae bacterium]